VKKKSGDLNHSERPQAAKKGSLYVVKEKKTEPIAQSAGEEKKTQGKVL